MAAATNGSPGAVQLLLEKGADANVRSKLGETPLGNAAGAGNAETVKLLLDRGADVNSRNSRGYSPLMLAAGSDAMNADIVKLLIAKGADTSFSADYDETAHMLAGRRGDTQVTRLLGGVAKSGVNRRKHRRDRTRSQRGADRRRRRSKSPCRCSKSRATTSSASAAAIRVMRRISCRRPRASRATAAFPRRSKSRSCRSR